MSRGLRIEYDGALYHVMNRGVGRMSTFRDDDDRKRFLSFVEKTVVDGDIAVLAFCLMPNHYHLLCSTPHGGLNRWMRSINGGYARAFNQRHGRVGHLWQGRYKALLVEDGQYMLECSRYIHLNPNRGKLTRPTERYRWSSYRNYVGGPTVVDWIERQPILNSVGGDAKQYRAYVESGKGEKQLSPFERATAGLVLGAESFVTKVRKMLEDRVSDEQPSLNELRRSGLPSAESVEHVVNEIFGDEPSRRRGRMKLYTLRKFSNLTTTAIAKRYGRRHSAVSMAVKAIDEEASKSPALAKRIARLSKRLSNEK